MKEIWKPIGGYEGLYEVSNMGRIKSFYNSEERILKKSKTTTGYWKIELRKNKIRKSFKVHRLVAFAFIANPENKPYINHIDGNPLNNKVDNLEWCTQHENLVHAYSIGLRDSFRIQKNTLKDLYADKKLSASEIANMFGVTKTVILYNMKKFNIKRRDGGESKIKYNLTKDFIINELKNKNQKTLAKEIGCDQSLISHYVKRIKERGKIYE